jgi:hypothetical protein
VHFAPPSWERARGTLQLDTASVRELLARAQLPQSELVKMGAPGWLLRNGMPVARWIGEEVATPVLGRIQWDARHGARGDVWLDTSVQRAAARVYGAATVRRFFS